MPLLTSITHTHIHGRSLRRSPAESGSLLAHTPQSTSAGRVLPCLSCFLICELLFREPVIFKRGEEYTLIPPDQYARVSRPSRALNITSHLKLWQLVPGMKANGLSIRSSQRSCTRNSNVLKVKSHLPVRKLRLGTKVVACDRSRNCHDYLPLEDGEVCLSAPTEFIKSSSVHSQDFGLS
ncbi:hypothetical protein FB45DRAFT_86016 [Roridomyces roridus]|uniref:Uncharacterized protein n=1 Tax=Roridomyces roridus TaxID=1738132 RepID=A0AAD7BLM7_9AGAR|nr:hypothetical protein FB45DRAFT_86016 [Roridomyces roridus]